MSVWTRPEPPPADVAAEALAGARAPRV